MAVEIRVSAWIHGKITKTRCVAARVGNGAFVHGGLDLAGGRIGFFIVPLAADVVVGFEDSHRESFREALLSCSKAGNAWNSLVV
jgi:hypothetical protein